MAMDQKTLAKRLREAREACKRTQEEVAAAMGLQRTAIAQIEAGNRSVSSLELLKLAQLYDREFSDFFTDAPPVTDEDPLVVLHRLAPGLEDDPAVLREVEHCLQVCREGIALEQILGRDARIGPPAYRVAAPRSAGEAVRQGAHIASQERQRLGLGNAPVADMADLLNTEGIWAAGLSLPDHMSGLFLNHSSTGMVVLVNFDHARARKRFSYAHEYAHALIDRDRAGTVTTQENASDLVEKRANAFAAAFLIPRAGVNQFLQTLDKGQPSRVEQLVFDVATEGRIDAQLRPEPGSQTLAYQDIARVADWFKVSYRAAVYRLRSLNYLSQKECNTLLEQESLANDFKQLMQSEEAEAPARGRKRDRELVLQVAHLAVEAYRREEISRGRLFELADLLGVDGRKLLDFAQASKSE